MSLPIANSSPVDAAVASWSQIDSSNAKVALSGNIDVYSLGDVWTKIRQDQDLWLGQGEGKGKSLIFDASQAKSLDGSGIAFLIDVQEAQQKAGGKFDLQGFDPKYQPLLHEFEPIESLFPVRVVRPKIGLIESTGMATQNLLKDGVGLITFTGHLAPDQQKLLVGEMADLWFHCLIALSQFGLRPEDVIGELERRLGTSGIEEKAARKAAGNA